MSRLLLAAVILPALLAAQTPHKLLVISIGGLDARFLNDPALKVKAPNLRRLMKEGASATVVGVVPSDTWPSHASLVTGVSPWQNGITAEGLPERPGDAFFSVDAVKAPTLWSAAVNGRLKVATVYWPSTLGAHVDWNFPEYWETRRDNAVPLADVGAKSFPAGLTDRVAQMFPAFDKQLWDDTSSADAAMYLLSAEQPDVLFVHMGDLDAEQRETTAVSIYARDILENDDDLVGQIVRKAPAGTIVAIVSDHGFQSSFHVVRPRVQLRQAGVKGTVEVRDGLIGTRDAGVAKELRKLAAETRKSGIAREVPMAEVRARAPSLGKWIAAFDTPQDYVARDEERGSAVGTGPHAGVCDFWPTHVNYRSLLILNGTGIKPTKLGEVDMLQIAPTLAEILGVKLPLAKSTSLWRSVSH
ncbi:MAG TPA: alkaline phosphatase family protein [Rhizomicrobium sp.]|nr:alkaline phosphatase family protein [Rhizomicrobium sp.]